MMLNKSLYFTLLILVAQELILTTGNDVETGKAVLGFASRIKPFLPLAQTLGNKIVAAGKKAEVVTAKMEDVGKKLKDGTADLDLKRSVAEDIANLGTEVKNVLNEVKIAVAQGNKLIGQFSVIANKLKEN